MSEQSSGQPGTPGGDEVRAVGGARRRKPAVRFIFFTILLDALGIGLIIPVAPELVRAIIGGDAASAAPIVGWLGATFAIFQLVFAPMLGSLSDRFGRRPVLLVSLFGSALDYFAAALGPSIIVLATTHQWQWHGATDLAGFGPAAASAGLALLFVTRAINGISGANITACNAYIADVTPPEKRAAGFGIVGAAFGIGFVVGPALGGTLGELDPRYPFIAAGVLTLCNWFYGLLVLPESLPRERRRPFSLARANPLGVFAHLLRYPVVLALAGALLLLSIAMFQLHATWVLYTGHRYHWSELQTGLSLTCVGIGAAIVQGGLARRIIPRLGEPASLLTGIAIAVIAYTGYASATQGWMIYALVLVASIGGIAQPALQAIVSKSVPMNEQGEVQGALAAVGAVASVIGFPLGGAVFGYFISDRAPAYVPGAALYLSAAWAALGLAVAAWALRGRMGREAFARQQPDDRGDVRRG